MYLGHCWGLASDNIMFFSSAAHVCARVRSRLYFEPCSWCFVTLCQTEDMNHFIHSTLVCCSRLAWQIRATWVRCSTGKTNSLLKLWKQLGQTWITHIKSYFKWKTCILKTSLISLWLRKKTNTHLIYCSISCLSPSLFTLSLMGIVALALCFKSKWSCAAKRKHRHLNVELDSFILLHS